MKNTISLGLLAAVHMGAMAGTTTLFESTGTNCRDFAVVAPVDAQVARSLVPAKYALPKTVYGLVELASCESGTAGNVSTGAFKIAEVGIMLPTAKGKAAFPLGGPNLYMLWLLDTDAQQSAPKLTSAM